MAEWTERTEIEGGEDNGCIPGAILQIWVLLRFAIQLQFHSGQLKKWQLLIILNTHHYGAFREQWDRKVMTLPLSVSQRYGWQVAAWAISSKGSFNSTAPLCDLQWCCGALKSSTADAPSTLSFSTHTIYPVTTRWCFTLCMCNCCLTFGVFFEQGNKWLHFLLSCLHCASGIKHKCLPI